SRARVMLVFLEWMAGCSLDHLRAGWTRSKRASRTETSRSSFRTFGWEPPIGSQRERHDPSTPPSARQPVWLVSGPAEHRSPVAGVVCPQNSVWGEPALHTRIREPGRFPGPGTHRWHSGAVLLTESGPRVRQH